MTHPRKTLVCECGTWPQSRPNEVGMPKSRGQGTGHRKGRKEGRKCEPNGESSFKSQTFLPSSTGPAFPPTSQFFVSVLIISRFVYSVISDTEKKINICLFLGLLLYDKKKSIYKNNQIYIQFYYNYKCSRNCT